MAGAERYTEDQVALFDEVMYKLATDLEVRGRTELSNHLAPIDNAPSKVVKALAADDQIAVAAPVLVHSTRLSEADLLQAAVSKGQQHLLAISARQSLSEAVTNVLVERGNQQVVRSVARNNGAKFSTSAFENLVKKSEQDQQLALHVGSRADIPKHQFSQLMANASPEMQEKIAAANPTSLAADASDKAASDADPGTRDYTAAKATIHGLVKSGKLGERVVHEFAKARKFEETVVGLAAICRVPIGSIERSMLEDSPDMIVIVAKAAKFNWATAKLLIWLAANDRSITAEEWEHARNSFDRLQLLTAERLVKFFNV
ncbi:MAG TPA: DUF2336 domain-containing protein, partial [Xanthobacteraceae bacterium]|nr:DUF2336 domain-containing protein [Xanthobacteraceae bacterium]